MKILVITREFPPWIAGGISYHLSHLYSRLTDDHDITVLTGRPWNTKQYDEGLIPNGVTVESVPFGVRQGYHVLAPAALGARLKTMNLAAYDVAVAHTPTVTELDVPLVTKYHDCVRESRQYYYQRLSRPAKAVDLLVDPVRRRIEKRSLTVSDYAIFNSHLCADAWNQNYGVGNDHEVIHNGVDVSTFYPREPTDDEGYVLFVGGLERKGLSEVIRFGRESDHRVRIVGYDSDEEIDGVETLGKVKHDRLPQLYSDAAVTIHPTRFEAFGNVVLESIACGTPVVTTDRCGAAEMTADRCAVVTSDLETGVEQAKTLDKSNCINHAQQYTWEEVADRTMSTLREVVDDAS